MNELEILQKSLEVSRSTLIVSVVVSSITIILGIIGLVIQRSHNKKSIKPFCDIIKRNYTNKIEIILTNRGLGPMIIDGVFMTNNNMKKEESYPIDIVPKYITIPLCSSIHYRFFAINAT